jgi:hypothetical protein
MIYSSTIETMNVTILAWLLLDFHCEVEIKNKRRKLHLRGSGRDERTKQLNEMDNRKSASGW